MKKLLLFAFVAAAAMSCQQKGQTTTEAVDSAAVDTAVYVGMIPQADGSGFKTILKIAGDNSATLKSIGDDNGSAAAEEKVGKVDTATQDVKGAAVKTLIFVNGADTTYFVRKDDNTLRMVNSDFEEAAVQPEQYDLKKK